MKNTDKGENMYINRYQGTRYNLRNSKSFEDEFHQVFSNKRILCISDTVKIRKVMKNSANRDVWKLIEDSIIDSLNGMPIQIHLDNEE